MRFAVFALLIPLMLACDDTESTGPSEPQEEVTVVTGSNLRFSPANVELVQGGTVTWAFNAVGHNVTFANVQGAPQDIGTSFNAQIPRTFPTTGTFNYQCTIHVASGMVGTIVVR
jgi:plastocyanin